MVPIASIGISTYFRVEGKETQGGAAALPEQVARDKKSIDLLTCLLQTISKSIGYDCGEIQLKRGAYFPQSHADDNIARIAIRDSLLKILSGEFPGFRGSIGRTKTGDAFEDTLWKDTLKNRSARN